MTTPPQPHTLAITLRPADEAAPDGYEWEAACSCSRWDKIGWSPTVVMAAERPAVLWGHHYAAVTR